MSAVNNDKKTFGLKVSNELKVEANELKDGLGMQAEEFLRALLDAHHRVSEDPSLTIAFPSSARKEVRVFGEYMQHGLELLNSVVMLAEDEANLARKEASESEEKLKNQLLTEKDYKKSLAEELAGKDQLIAALEQQVADMKQQVLQLKSHSESFEALRAAHQDKENSLNATIVALQEENANYSELKKDVHTKELLIQDLEGQKVQMAHEHELAVKDIEATTSQELGKQSAEIIRLQAVNDSMVQQMTDVQESVKSLNATCVDLRNDKDALREDNLLLKRSLGELKAENSSLRSSKEQLETEMGQFREAVGQHMDLNNF